MWYQRQLKPLALERHSLPICVLKGPRQVGKTSLLEKALTDVSVIRLDDIAVRNFIADNPRTYLDQFSGRILIDEAPLVPSLFSELKRRVDEDRRLSRKSPTIWLTGSNQTLIRKNVEESLAGRASYFDLNTLSLHEIGTWSLSDRLIRGGWPELLVNQDLSPLAYLNDFISTFIDRDIVAAAGVERKAAFSKALALVAARQGMSLNYSEIAGLVGVEITTIQSWIQILVENGILVSIEPFQSNLNKRLTKMAKVYFCDASLAARIQGWTSSIPLTSSLQFGFHLEAIALGEITRFFSSRGMTTKVFSLRSKERVELDFLIELPNQRFLVFEIKATPQPISGLQRKLVDSLNLDVIEILVVSPHATDDMAGVLDFSDIHSKLESLIA